MRLRGWIRLRARRKHHSNVHAPLQVVVHGVGTAQVNSYLMAPGSVSVCLG